MTAVTGPARPVTSPTGIILTRRQSRSRVVVPPRLGRVLTATLVAAGGYLAVSVALAPAGAHRWYDVGSGQGGVPMLSTGMLLMAAVLAAAARRSVRGDTVRARRLWTTLTAVMLYLAVDEVVGLHQLVGGALDGRVPRGPFRTWSDVVVILYGVLALPPALLLWREVLRYRRLLTMLLVTAGIFGATAALDSTVMTPTQLSSVVQDALQGACCTLFMLSMLTGLVAARSMELTRQGQVASSPQVPRTEAAVMVVGALVPMAFCTLAVLVVPDTGAHLRAGVAWLGAVLGAGLVLLGVTRLDRSHVDADPRYADFWTARAGRRQHGG